MSKQLEGEQLLKLPERLLILQASILERKKRVDSDLNRESGPIPADFSEQAMAVENDEALVAIQGELEVQLSQIRHALKRLESGSYGLCERCNLTIGSARLEAIPTTSLCINCASLKV